MNTTATNRTELDCKSSLRPVEFTDFGELSEADTLERISASFNDVLPPARQARRRQTWERFLSYEIGHLQVAMEAFKRIEKRDPAEIVPATLPDPIAYESHRQFVKDTFLGEVDLRADGKQYVDKLNEPQRSLDYRAHLNSRGCPSEQIADGYRWTPGTELVGRVTSAGDVWEGRIQ